jgi:hypothetical protein
MGKVQHPRIDEKSNDRKLVSTGGAADVLQTFTTTARKLAREGRIPFLK